jgi:2-polyprenyl-6-hydroxyphenyl methylase/3-demethylubiquinone-9 3-methyltransferase
MLAGCPGEVTRVCGTATRLPFEAGSFDHAFAIEVFEHLHPSAWVAALAELRRVIRLGGRLAIVDKNAASIDPARPWLPGLLVKKIDERRGLWMYPSGAPARERWFWPGQMARLLRSAGFVSVRAGVVRFGDHGRLPALLERFQVWSAGVPARGGGT